MKKYIVAIVGLLFGAVLLWLVFRTTDWDEVLASIRNIHVGWLIAAHVPLMLSFPARVQRWSYIVRAAHPVTFGKMFSATQIGFLANFVLPGRVGEAIRALVLTRLTDIKFSKSFAFVALDRVTDLFGLITVVTISILAFRPTSGVTIPPETFGTSEPVVFTQAQYQGGAILAGVFLIAIVTAFVLLYVAKGLVLRISDAILGVLSKGFAKWVNGILSQFADGFHVFRSPLDMTRAIAFSFLTWGLGILMLVFMLEAFRIDYPWYTPFVMQAMLAVFISAPNTPGFVGQFHVPIVLALVMTVSTIDPNEAKAFAIVTHLIQLPPVILLGVWRLMHERMGLLQLQSEGKKLAHEEHEDHEDC